MNIKKKIGCVLAVRRKNHNNYGTSLQAYATIVVLHSLGYQVEIIRKNISRSIFESLALIPIYLRNKAQGEMLMTVNKKLAGYLLKEYNKNNEKRNKAVEEFKENFFEPLCKYYTSYDALKEGSKNYDLCLTGSDQLWHPMGFASAFYNLMFVDENVPKISYASSFGVSEIPKHQLAGTKKYLERFNWISVREERGKEIVESISNAKADFVCDPTMLLTKQEWEDFSQPSKHKIKEPYIFCYFLGERKDIRKRAIELQEKTGYKIVAMRHVDKYLSVDKAFGDYAPYDISPVDFVNLLSNAEIVLTDSFHGTIFSIIMEKKFVTFYRVNPSSKASTHSRIDSLLKRFGLESRIDNNDIYEQAVKAIDYSKIRPLVNEFRSNSLALLKRNIEKYI